MAMNSPVDDLAAEVGKVLDLVLGRPVPAEPGYDVARAEIPEWDSLRHVELVLTLEERFAVRFDADEVREMTSSGRIVELLARKRSETD